MEKETHDFMNVDSFSELPFLRPSPPVKEKGIRLFGKLFSTGSDIYHKVGSESQGTKEENHIESGGESSSTNRKFECHYCCRNFPTSQALGGHQNAHKRERQNAKRAHLQSAMVHGGYPQVYAGIMNNYNRFASAPSVIPYHSASSSWSSSTSNDGKSFNYGGHGGFYNYQPHAQQPITGSPLALWRVPSAPTCNTNIYERRSTLNQPPLFANEGSTGNMGNPNSQNRYLYESKASAKDHVSLDLRL